MNSRYFNFLCSIFLILILSWNISTAQNQRKSFLYKFQKENPAPDLNVVWDTLGNHPRIVTGMLIPLPIGMNQPQNDSDIVNIIHNFLDKYNELFLVTKEDIKKKKIWKYQNKWYVLYQTYYKDLPVFEGKVGFTLDSQGRILTFSSNYNPGMLVNIQPKISKDSVVQLAYRYHKPKFNLPVAAKDVHLMIYQDRNSKDSIAYKLVWYVFLATNAGHMEVDRVFFIDASTGNLIRDYFPDPNNSGIIGFNSYTDQKKLNAQVFFDTDRGKVVSGLHSKMKSITGTIQGEIYQEHSTDPVSIVPFEHEEISVPGNSANTNATGNYILTPGNGNYTLTTGLEGPFVRVQSYDAATNSDQDITHTANVNDPGAFNFTWRSTNSAPDDGDGLNVFWHANHLHDDYYQNILGISWTNDWTNTSCMNYSVNRGNQNNAFAGNPITIYSNNAARNCDIVYHESTHNVLYDIFGGSYIGWPSANSEGYAFDEGFADYAACSFNNDHLFGENVIATRDCDNTMQYPGTTYNTEGHTGGQLISGVAWDLWNKEGLNHNNTDILLFEGLSQMATLPSPYYFSNPNHSNYLNSLLTADDNNNNLSDGTPNDRQIFQAFRNHDLLPVDVFSKDSPQDVGNVPSPGNAWTSPDIWVRNLQDGGTVHQNPIYNQTNYIYVKVRNLGYLTANSIKVKVYWADPSGGIPWPAGWNFINETNVTNLLANSETVAVPIAWKPTGTAIGHRCLLVRLECSQDLMTEEGKVRLENNIAMKNVSIINLKTVALPKLVKADFFIKNFPKGSMDLIITGNKVESIGHPIENAPFPFSMELHIEKLKGFSEVSGGRYDPGAGSCLSWLTFLFAQPKFVLGTSNVKISSLRLEDVDKSLSTLKIYPLSGLQTGEVYEITVKQIVNEQVIGGLTYLIQVD